MSSRSGSPVVKPYDNTAAVQCGNRHTQKAMSLGSEIGDVRLTKSRSSCVICIHSMDTKKLFSMHECVRKMNPMKAETIQRELDLVERLSKARAHIIEKEKEVCDLQGQLEKELMEKQGLFYEVIKRDKEILRLQETLAGSKAPAQRYVPGSKSVSKCLPPGMPFSLMLQPMLPELASRHSVVSPHGTPRDSWQADKKSTPTNFCRKSAIAPVSARSLIAVMQNPKGRSASPPLMHAHGMPPPRCNHIASG